MVYGLIDPGIARRVLALEMGENDAGATTVREYLTKLLTEVWEYREGFDGKRPFGNSGWEYELYHPLGKAGLIAVTFDEDGYIDQFPPEEQRKADELIAAMIREMSTGLTFREVSQINRMRCERWHPNFPNDNKWGGSDWSNAMAGEAGETCNVVKKLRRIDTGIQQTADDTRDSLMPKLAKEIGDTFIYLDLLAQFYRLDMAACVVQAFNQASEREGFPERIEGEG